MKKIDILNKIPISKEEVSKLIGKFPYKKDMADYLGINLYQLNLLVDAHSLSYPKTPSRKGKCGIKEYTFIDREWLIEKWVNTSKSLSDLSIEYNVPLSTLENRASRAKVTKKYKHQINTEKLFNLNDINVWYLAGLVATDGYVPSHRNAIEITMVGESEKKLLQSILNYFECTSLVSEYSTGKYTIRITADGLNDFLMDWFSIPSGAKTFTVGVPKEFPNEGCARAYIRGCLDGDGSIKSSKLSVTLLTASSTFIDGIHSIIKTYSGVDTHRYVEGGYPLIRIGGHSAKQLLDWVYNDNGLRLERKYLSYKNHI